MSVVSKILHNWGIFVEYNLSIKLKNTHFRPDVHVNLFLCFDVKNSLFKFVQVYKITLYNLVAIFKMTLCIVLKTINCFQDIEFLY